MTFPAFKASLGAARISKSDARTLSGVTRDTRAQMEGITKNFQAFIKHMEGLNASILAEALKPVFEESKRQVPVDTGELKASGYLVKRKFRGRQQVEIGYGKGGNPPYAAQVHEDLNAYHASPTKAKFLEDPLSTMQGEVQALIIQGMKEASGV